MVAYDLTTVVRDAIVHVDPSLNGRRVRVLVLTDEEPLGQTAAFRRLLDHAVSGVRFVPMTRDQANERT